MNFDLLDTKLIWATERLIEPESRHSTMCTDDIPAWLIRQGSVRVRCNVGQAEARTGQWIVPGPGTVRHDFTADAVLISIRFRLRLQGGDDLFPRVGPLVIAEQDDSRLTQAAEALVVKWRERSGSDAGACVRHFALQACFYAWLERYAQTMDDRGVRSGAVVLDARLARARGLLQGHRLAQRLSRRRLSADVGWSVPQLTRCFAEEFGVTPRRFLECRRFDWACNALAGRDRAIKEIAGELGFVSLAHFSNWFTRLAGKSPRRYRQQSQV